MLVALSDTHGDASPGLTDHLRGTVDSASLVLHAGDFTTAAVLDAFESLSELVAVAGNSDTASVRARLPETQVVERFDRRFLVVHGHRHDSTALSLLGRQENADVGIVGHTHSPGVDHVGGMTVVNPGSHADPRGSRPTYAAFEQAADQLELQLRTVGGRVVDAVRV